MEKPKEQYPLIDLGSAALEEKIVRLIPPEFSRKYKAIAVGRDGKVLTVAFADPCDACAREDIRFVTAFDIQPVAASEQEIARALDVNVGTVKSRVHRARMELKEAMLALRPAWFDA